MQNPIEMQNLIDLKTWHFAKTMPWMPHWYARRREWGNNEEFNDLVAFIRKTGSVEQFGKTKYTYLYLNGYKYWTMGNPISTTILINRAKA